VPKFTTTETIKGVHVSRQQVGVPKSSESDNKCVKTSLPNTRASKMNGAYSNTDSQHLLIEQGVGGRGAFYEGLL